MVFEIKQIDPRNASDQEYAAMNAFSNRIRAEMLPDDPPIPLDEAIRGWRNIPAFVDVIAWGVVDGGKIIASGSISFLKTEENKHLVEFDIQVAPEYRRQGWARRLLAEIVQATQRGDRRLMITTTNERVPAGAAFMERLGADHGLETHTNQLKIDELDRDLIRTWQAQARERSSDFELGLWTGPYPEQDIHAIADLFQVMNTAPRDSLQVEDFRFTPEHLRQQEKSMTERGATRWTMYVRERATGKFAGFTEVFWHPNRPAILQQAGTGVFPEYRNRGLGRWLKAAMLDKVLRERPEVKYVRTGNADSNAPMLKINFELGFKPYFSQTVWQVEVERVSEYLNANR